MKIVIDIRPLGEEIHSGVQEYTLNIIRALTSKLNDEDQILLFSAGKKFELHSQVIRTLLSEKNNLSRKHLNVPSKLVNLSFKANRSDWFNDFLGEPDVFFAPNINFLPRFGKSVNSVLTIHDLSFLAHPEFFTKRQRIWHRLVGLKRIIESVNKIVAASYSTKSDLLDYFDIKSKKVKVVYPGIDKSFEELNLSSSKIKKIKAKYDLPRQDFILCLSTLEPRKNLQTLIKAFELLEENDLHLVLVGSEGWKYKELLQGIAISKYSERIHLVGPCERKERVYLYNLASIFVYPSYFEGFGLPPLEAMASGTPVITSHNSSLPEVVGDSAVLVDPRRPEEFAEAIEMVFKNEELKEKLIKEGKKRSLQFNWEKAASKLYEIF